MDLILNNTELEDKDIELFFDEEKVENFLVRKSKDKKIKFPWDTKAPRVYKYNNQFIKVYGLKRKIHFFTGHRYALLVKKSHDFLNKNNIKTVTQNLYAVKGKYSIVGTKDIESLGLILLPQSDPKTIKNSLVSIHNSLAEVNRYHGDNKSDNSAINMTTKEVYLLDIDSVRPYPLLWFLRNKMKRKTLGSLNRKVGELNKKIKYPDYKPVRI